MSVAAFWRAAEIAARPRHPNEIDLRRIAKALRQRQRYRYVEPSVTGAEGGYLIRAACCSRNVDPEGGEIDIALLRWREDTSAWVLQRKDHAAQDWITDSHYARLPELFNHLNADPERSFWQ